MAACSAANQENQANSAAKPNINQVNANFQINAGALPNKSSEEIQKLSNQAFSRNAPRNSAVQPKTPAVKIGNSLASRAAPDDSVFSSTMNEKGQPVEVRVFTNNSQIFKAERIYLSSEQKIIRVYLRNGKIVELKDDQIPNFAAASVISILNAAGIEPKTEIKVK